MVIRQDETLADLYLADETDWLDIMSELIGAGRLSELDYPHLKEYLEDMATRDRREVYSRLRLLLKHVLKWIFQKQMRTPSWQETILEQQAQLDDEFQSRVLRNYAVETLAEIYAKALKQAARETNLDVASFPADCPWTLDQLLSDEILNEQVS
jgi:Domain of unknown function DUF29